MARASDFTRGAITPQIMSLALPIMGTAFIQMAYNMADFYWIGHLSGIAAAAVGAMGLFAWLGVSFSLLTKVGAEITISQSIGARTYLRADRYAQHAIVLSAFFGLLFGLFLFFFRVPLVSFFSFTSPVASYYANDYLAIVSFGSPFVFLNATFFGLYNGKGRSKLAFWANGIGLLLNMLLDPLLIEGYFFFPRMEVAGAALATSFSQLCVTMVFCLLNLRKDALFPVLFKRFRFSFSFAKRILRLGVPVTLLNGLFAGISLVIARLVAQWGDIGVAVQSVGAQIEAISWMTAGGFSTALASFVGQNWGAQNIARIKKGYRLTLAYMLSLGVVSTLLFMLWGEEIMGFFIPEKEAMFLGGRYLFIIGVSQIFMILEITNSGVFNGIGRTTAPAVVGTTFNLLRIPLALWWGSIALEGIWWGITVSSILKGTVLTVVLLAINRRRV